MDRPHIISSSSLQRSGNKIKLKRSDSPKILQLSDSGEELKHNFKNQNLQQSDNLSSSSFPPDESRLIDDSNRDEEERKMRFQTHKSAIIFLLCILLSSCQQFYLTEEEQKIIDEATENLEQIRKENEAHMIIYLTALQEGINKTGRRKYDVENFENAIYVFEKYKEAIRILDKSNDILPLDSILKIDPDLLNLEENDFYTNEIQPLNITHLKAIVSTQTLSLLRVLVARHGYLSRWESLRLALIQGIDSTELFLTVDDYPLFALKEVNLNPDFEDSISNQFPVWTEVEYSQMEEMMVVKYYDSENNLQERTFSEAKSLKLLR